MERKFSCYTPSPYFDFRQCRSHPNPCAPSCDYDFCEQCQKHDNEFCRCKNPAHKECKDISYHHDVCENHDKQKPSNDRCCYSLDPCALLFISGIIVGGFFNCRR